MFDHDEQQRRMAELARKEQREASERGRKSQDIGRWFHYGMAELRGETPEKGWQHEVSVKLPSGRERIHDNLRSVNDREFREYKAAKQVGGEFVMEQISKDRENLTTDPKAKGSWVVLEGSPDAAARQELDALERDFPGRFRVEEVTKAQAKRAEAIGKELERNRDQLELLDSSKLRGQQRAKEQREKAQEIQRTREAAQQALERQQREREAQQREREILVEQERQREAKERVAEHIRQQQEAAARGEPTPMDYRVAADILRINRPNPGYESPHREHPQVGSTKDSRSKERSRGLERDR